MNDYDMMGSEDFMNVYYLDTLLGSSTICDPLGSSSDVSHKAVVQQSIAAVIHNPFFVS